MTLGLLGGFDTDLFIFPHQQLRKLVLEIIHRIPTNEHLRPHTKNVLSVMFRFLEVIFENFLLLSRILIVSAFLIVESSIRQLFPFSLKF